jgi:hypothetical protein
MVVVVSFCSVGVISPAWLAPDGILAFESLVQGGRGVVISEVHDEVVVVDVVERHGALDAVLISCDEIKLGVYDDHFGIHSVELICDGLGNVERRLGTIVDLARMQRNGTAVDGEGCVWWC